MTKYLVILKDEEKMLFSIKELTKEFHERSKQLNVHFS